MTIEASAAPSSSRPTSAVGAAHALARLTRHLEHALSEAGLTLPQYRLLLFLAKRPDAANRLAANLHVRPPSLTALVDGMEARSLVDRTTDPEDRRRVRIVITELGSETLATADAIAGARLEHLESLDPDQGSLTESLAAWHGALEVSLAERSGR